MTDGEAGVTNYTYDVINRLTKIKNPDNEETDYTYDDAGRKTKTEYSNGTYTDYVYDNANRILLLVNKKSTGDTISSFTYTYDDAGNRLSKTYANGDTEIYSYDDIYQLTKVEKKDSITEYEYDKVGNRLQMKTVTANDTNLTNYTYNSDNQLLYYTTDGSDTVSFTYDDNGNQTHIAHSSSLILDRNYQYDYGVVVGLLLSPLSF
jgi:YD repeat-containing protein